MSLVQERIRKIEENLQGNEDSEMTLKDEKKEEKKEEKKDLKQENLKDEKKEEKKDLKKEDLSKDKKEERKESKKEVKIERKEETEVKKEIDLSVKVQKLAPIVQETVQPVLVKEIQPVVDIHRHETEVQQIVQPLTVREEKELQVKATLLPQQVEEIRKPIGGEQLVQLQQGFSDIEKRKEVLGTQVLEVEKEAQVTEHIHRKVIQEIQPVILKETVVPQLELQAQPIVKKIIEPVEVVRIVNPPLELKEGEKLDDKLKSHEGERKLMTGL